MPSKLGGKCPHFILGDHWLGGVCLRHAFGLIPFPYFFLAMHQPPDPAVVTVSETRLPPQQQKNILQVCRFIIYTD